MFFGEFVVSYAHDTARWSLFGSQSDGQYDDIRQCGACCLEIRIGRRHHTGQFSVFDLGYPITPNHVVGAVCVFGFIGVSLRAPLREAWE